MPPAYTLWHMIYLVRASPASLLHSSGVEGVGVLTLLSINEVINQQKTVHRQAERKQDGAMRFIFYN